MANNKRPPSDVDPKALTVPRKRRRHKARTRPAPDPELQDTEGEARARADARRYPPAVMLEDDGEGWQPTPDHSDDSRWLLQMADAFGTRSIPVIEVFFRHLRDLCRESWDELTQSWKTDETELNALIAMVNDVGPENTQEAAFAAQMASVHLLQMRMTRQALNRGGYVFAKDAATASRLARTYTEQMAELRRMRGGEHNTFRQDIHVHKHYHHHREGEENDGRPQEARASTIEGRATLPSDMQGNPSALPSPRDARKAGLPDPWREESRREER